MTAYVVPLCHAVGVVSGNRAVRFAIRIFYVSDIGVGMVCARIDAVLVLALRANKRLASVGATRRVAVLLQRWEGHVLQTVQPASHAKMLFVAEAYLSCD